MIEITKENFNCEETVDKYQPKHFKNESRNYFLEGNKAILYLIGAFAIFAIANIILIYNFFRILEKL